ncbi:MAG TPA: asparagine--tRNA ligase [Candidatus Melainabacteria bacterium]|nr:asparagine--tRNA ligase [Candidatus Melainabacteria bacterium]
MTSTVKTTDRIPVKEALCEESIGKKVKICGWVRTRRDSKAGFSFIELNDGSSFNSIQVVAPKELDNYESEILHAGIGSSLEILGEVVESPGKGQATEVKADSVKVLGFADPKEYPLQKKGTSFEFLRTIGHLRPRTNTFGAVARVRNEICRAIHEFFQSRGFVYVHTPIITGSDCEGAGQMFKVTTFDLDNVPRKESSKEIDFEQDFFGRQTNLTVSGQLEAEIYATALSNVYTFGPTFRAENSNTSRHLSEFWMIEPEMAFCDLEGDMDVAEAFLKHIFSSVLKNCPDDMNFFNQRIDKTVIETLTAIVESDFHRLSYTEAIEILEKSGESFEFPVKWGIDLQSEHERYLTEKKFKKPVIVYDYPREIKAFYMRLNEDGKTVRAMDVLVPKVGEIIGGSQREERLDVLKERMIDCDLNPEEYWWYLDLRRYGTVPHAGFGLGLERTVQFVTGMANIRDVIPFPRAPKTADF